MGIGGEIFKLAAENGYEDQLFIIVILLIVALISYAIYFKRQ